MSIFITEDRRHTCIKLGLDIIKISSDNIGNKYVLRFVICLLQPINCSEYYLCPSNLSSYIIYLSICYYLHFKLWIYPFIYSSKYLSSSPLLCGPNHLSRLKSDSSRFNVCCCFSYTSAKEAVCSPLKRLIKLVLWASFLT